MAYVLDLSFLSPSSSKTWAPRPTSLSPSSSKTWTVKGLVFKACDPERPSIQPQADPINHPEPYL